MLEIVKYRIARRRPLSSDARRFWEIFSASQSCALLGDADDAFPNVTHFHAATMMMSWEFDGDKIVSLSLTTPTLNIFTKFVAADYNEWLSRLLNFWCDFSFLLFARAYEFIADISLTPVRHAAML